MSYHSHTLNFASHSHIIARKDPITGDAVKENDKVVFCAACKSCFLEESWIYMEEKHCEQSQTLETVPTLPSKLIAKKTKEEVIAELLYRGNIFYTVLPTLILTFLTSFGILKETIYAQNIENAVSVSIMVSIVSTFAISFFTATDAFNEFVGNTKNNVRLFKNRIEINKDFFLWNDIEQIKYQREMYINEDDKMKPHLSHTPFILIYFKGGSFIKQDLATKKHRETEKFLIGLEKISHFKQVFFYSENPIELEVMRNIKYRSKGNIEIGNPRKLLNYNTFW